MFGKHKLIAFGCSLTYGEELANPRINSYPAVIANHFKMQLDNRARPGDSNDRIERLITEWLALDNYEDTAVVIGWTSASRGEYYLGGHTYKCFIPGQRPPFVTVFEKEVQHAHEVIVGLSDQASLFAEYNSMVFRTQSILKFHSVPFVMVNSLYPVNVVGEANIGFWPNLDITLPKLTFHEWTIRNGFQTGANMHPLEHAHTSWANQIISQIDQ